MPVVPIDRTILSQVVLPIVAWGSFCFGLVSIVIAFFPPPPPVHPFIDYIRGSAPMVTPLVVGTFLAVAGLSMIIRSRLAQSRTTTDPSTGETKPTTESWKTLDSYDDQPTAEALVEILLKRGVPAKVEVDSPVPGLLEGVRVVVADELFHRAKWVISQGTVSQRELELAAMGNLADSDDAKE